MSVHGIHRPWHGILYFLHLYGNFCARCHGLGVQHHRSSHNSQSVPNKSRAIHSSHSGNLHFTAWCRNGAFVVFLLAQANASSATTTAIRPVGTTYSIGLECEYEFSRLGTPRCLLFHQCDRSEETARFLFSIVQLEHCRKWLHGHTCRTRQP